MLRNIISAQKERKGGKQVEKPQVILEPEEEKPVIKVQVPDETIFWNASQEGSDFPDDPSY